MRRESRPSRINVNQISELVYHVRRCNRILYPEAVILNIFLFCPKNLEIRAEI